MKKLIEFSDEDIQHIATIKTRYSLRFDVDAIKYALEHMASNKLIEPALNDYEAQVQREITSLAAKDEALRRYNAYKAETQTAYDVFEEMGL